MAPIARRPKILIEAYECSPCRSHAAGSAWQIISRLSRHYELWIVTEDTQYGDEVRDHIKNNPACTEHLHFHFLPREEKLKKRCRPVLPIRETLQYEAWLKRSYNLGVDLHRCIGFDATHHLRGNSFRRPGYYWKLPVPFIWGPTGGTTVVPWGMLWSLGLRGCVAHIARSLSTEVQLRHSSCVERAARTAACVLTQTSQDKLNFSRVYGIAPLVVHEQGTGVLRCVQREYDGKRKLRVAWIGQCIARKGLPFLMNALAVSGLRHRIEVHIVGDGPYRPRWQRMARVLQLEETCKWHGWLAHNDALDVLDMCDVLAFTSLLEGTPTAVMESLSYAVPVICLRHCGFGDVIDETCGISLNASNPTDIVCEWARAMRSLVEHPERIAGLSRGAARRASECSWDALAEGIDRAYRIALAME